MKFNPSKILIIKTSALGDIIHSFPVVAYLKERFPHVEIDWVVEEPFQEIVKAHPDINQTISVRTKLWRKNLFRLNTWKDIRIVKDTLRQKKYDLVIDLQGNTKSGLICHSAFSDLKIGFGWNTVPEKLNLLFTNHKYNPPKGQNIRADYLYLIRSFLGDLKNEINYKGVSLILTIDQKKQLTELSYLLSSNNRRKVMVCPGAFWKNKQLSIHSLKQFLKQLLQENPCSFFFVWGNEAEQKIAVELQEFFYEDSVILPKMPLPVLQHMMQAMNLVVAMDSLPLHLAGTTTTPTFSFFGPSSASKYQPEGSQHKSYQGKCPYGRSFDKRCPILRTCKTGLCLRGVNPMDQMD